MKPFILFAYNFIVINTIYVLGWFIYLAEQNIDDDIKLNMCMFFKSERLTGNSIIPNANKIEKTDISAIWLK